MMPHGIYGHSQRMERPRTKYAQLSEKPTKKQTQSETPTDRFKRIPALHQKEDLREFVVCYGDVSPRHFRLIDRVISYLIPKLKKLTIDITWHPALHNPKLQVSNLNTVTIQSTEHGVEFVCSDKTSARIDINLKEAFLQLVYERTNACHCLNRKMINISGLSEAISILEVGILQGTLRGGARLSPRHESFILITLRKLDVSSDTSENVHAIQSVLTTLTTSEPSSRRRLPCFTTVGALWIQYGMVPCLMSLLLDPTKNHHHGLFQSIKSICKALVTAEGDLASKAIVLYMCRALHQYGLQCRTVLVLISSLIEVPHFRKIAIEHFDLGQTCAKLLLIRSPFSAGETTSSSSQSLASGDGSSSRDVSLQVPPAYIVKEQLSLPAIATMTWNVPLLPYRRNPPELSIAQVSILKNLLWLSPLNNDGVDFRHAHLVPMLLAFVERGMQEHPQAVDNCQSLVLSLVMANVHEYSSLHPIQVTFANVPHFLAYKSNMELKPLDTHIKQILEMIVSHQGRYAMIPTGFRMLTDMVTSSPAAILSGMTAARFSQCFRSIQLPSLSTEFDKERKTPSVHLPVFDLLQTLLKRTSRFPSDLLTQFSKTGLIGSMFKTIDHVLEIRDLRKIPEDEAGRWIKKCWKLLTALVCVCRSQQEHNPETLSQLEEQFAQELIDPFGFSETDTVSILWSLKFLTVYLDAEQCVLFDQVHVFLRLVRWIRETLNRAWEKDESDIVVAALDVVAVVSGHVTEASFSVVQSFVDGLMSTLHWIDPPDPERVQAAPQRTTSTPGWRQYKAGPSGLPPIPRGRSTIRRQTEIQPEKWDDGNREETTTASRRSRRSALQEAALRNFGIDSSPHPAAELDTMIKLEHFRSRFHNPDPGEPIDGAKTKGLVIPPLDLSAFTMVRDWYHGRRSVASTVFSSEAPTRPLSQLSDGSAAFSTHLRSGEWQNYNPNVDPLIFESDLYSFPDADDPATYDDCTPPHSHSEFSLADLGPRSSFVVQPSPNQITITLAKRANSTSAVDEVVFVSATRPNISEEQSQQLHKVHSFDKRRSRPSLSLLQLVGDSEEIESAKPPPPPLWSGSSLPNINFLPNPPQHQSPGSDISKGDPANESVITIRAGSYYTTDAKELEIDYDQDEGLLSDTAATTTTDSLTLSKYQLTNCDALLDNRSVHTAILKTFLRFLSADYHNKSRERPLTKTVSLGLHKHFHSVPISIIMILKDWAIRQVGENRSYILLKYTPPSVPFWKIGHVCRMVAKQLFDESCYPSLKRIGRGVFSSIHECSCPVLGGPSNCCVKAVDLPTDPCGMRSFQEVFAEIAVLQHVQQIPQTIRLYDFGTSEDNLYIVTKLYEMDLLTWRRQISSDSVVDSSKALFTIFIEVVKIVDMLHSIGVVHFDLKCSNVLLEMRERDTNRSRNYNELPFRVVLADFGEAMFMDKASEGLTRSRGTQVCMSPEMLVSGSAGKRVAPGASSDVWSLGCLFFELMTGALLFDDSDYSEFHTRLTSNSRTLVDGRRVEWIPEVIREPVLQCLSYLLVRNPAMRAPLPAVVEWLEHLLLTDILPGSGHVSPTADTVASRNTGKEPHRHSRQPESMDLEIRIDHLPLSPRVSIMRYAYASNPWSLAKHQVTHVVFIHRLPNSQSQEEERISIRNASLRANGLHFEIQIPPSEDVEQRSWTDHCQQCCDHILRSCHSSSIYHIAIVAGRHTGLHSRLIVRYLTQPQQHKQFTAMNLDGSLLK